MTTYFCLNKKYCNYLCNLSFNLYLTSDIHLLVYIIVSYFIHYSLATCILPFSLFLHSCISILFFNGFTFNAIQYSWLRSHFVKNCPLDLCSSPFYPAYFNIVPRVFFYPLLIIESKYLMKLLYNTRFSILIPLSCLFLILEMVLVGFRFSSTLVEVRLIFLKFYFTM